MSGYYELMYGDMFTWLLAIVGFVIVIYAQVTINSTYNKYKKKKINKDINGREAARMILEANKLDLYVVETQGELTDHYDPNRKVIKLSTHNFRDNTISAVAVAAHECGHALQDKDNYIFMRIRSMLVPVVNLVSYAGYFVMIISLFAGITSYFMMGIFLVLTTLVFQLITLPVEFDASKRGLEQLEKLNIVSPNEKTGARAVLKAAAFTYVAGVLSSLLQLIRLVLMFNRNRD